VVSIRALSVSDYDDWLEVYRVYAEHYQSELTEEGVSTTWNWLMDNENPLTGIIVARGRIELPTPCFSDKCSTD
jgi:predicted acetyltransferase